MTRALALLLCLLLAAPASAATRHLGTWVFGSGGYDNTRVLMLKVRDADNVGWGTSMGVCYTPYLEIRKKGQTDLYATMTGTWADSTEKDALFSIGAATVLSPSGTHQDYECYLVLKKGGAIGYMGSDDDAGLFTFRTRRWP